MPTDPARAKAVLLVIDDDPTVPVALEARLGRDFRIAHEQDPHRAVEAAKREKPDLILCDINMPGMQGDEVAFELSQDAATADIPLVYLTSLVARRASTVLEGQFGDHVAVSKGATTQELLAVIHAALG